MQSFNESLEELIGLKEDGSDELLKDLLKVLLNDLARYIRRRLRAAEITTAISRGKIKLQELLDEIYLVIHDRLGDIPHDETESKVWLFRVADEYLAEKLEELEFENKHFASLEKFVEKEYQSLEEGFSVDAEFELVPLEELDEYEDNRNVFSVNDFPFYKEDLDLQDEITLHLDKDVIHDIIDKELVKLPMLKRTIMELFLVEQMTVGEIAGIKDVSETAVEAVIREVNSHLKKKLSFLL
jgi:DNA-directed RNA polymerase specialized sigma24 family protein